MTTNLPDGLLDYLAIRDRHHADAVNATLAAMTERERRLVREATVMGFVRGARLGAATGPNGELPSDPAIVAGVVDACLAMDDLYPMMASLRGDDQ